MTTAHAAATRLVPLLLALTMAGGCATDEDTSIRFGTHRAPVTAYCTATVNGVGQVDVETDYLPNVVHCENGGASLEALKAQAVAARSYLYYKLNSAGSINDGTSDQVYSCSGSPGPEHYQAVADTAGVVLTYNNVVICAFYVAGAVPSHSDCVAVSGDNDYSNTEHYVTYNWGLSGSNIEQTTLGWVNSGNDYNRGCKSQNGAHCLSDAGWGYQDILKFYYGMDIGIEVAVGSCITPPECTPGATEQQSCVPCGTQTRTCDGSGSWGAWGACQSQGDCTPGDTESEACGECGQWTRECGSDCSWGAWGECASVETDEPCDTGESGICSDGVLRCVSAQLVCEPVATSELEYCDDLDNNCDGEVDEGFPKVLGDPPPAYAGKLEIVEVPGELEYDVPGEVTLSVENLGTEDWPSSGIELRAIGEGGAPTQLTSDGWYSSSIVLRLVGGLAAGDASTITFPITVPDGTLGELHESFWLAIPDGPLLSCPQPSVNIDITPDLDVNVGVPDAGPDTAPIPRVTSSCDCRTGGTPPGAIWLVPLMLWLLVRRRRSR